MNRIDKLFIISMIISFTFCVYITIVSYTEQTGNQLKYNNYCIEKGFDASGLLHGYSEVITPLRLTYLYNQEVLKIYCKYDYGGYELINYDDEV